MHQICFAPNFPAWRKASRHALQHGFRPDQIVWQEETTEQAGLNLFATETVSETSPHHRVPRDFLRLAQSTACHRDPRRWALMYELLWRVTHDEPHLMQVVIDPVMHELTRMDKAVRHDVHKMRAFVRFREVIRDGQSWFVSWFEPEHLIVEANAPFFTGRFASMNWSILTPDVCAHWDQNELTFSEGVTRTAAPNEDEIEDLWITYYQNIFNPGRVKTSAMQGEMPKKYWKNLPEAAAISSLVQEAPGRVELMMRNSVRPPSRRRS